MYKLRIILFALTILFLSAYSSKGQQKDNVPKPDSPPSVSDIPEEPDTLDDVIMPRNFKFDFRGLKRLELSAEQEQKYLKDIMPKIKKELEEIKKLNKIKYFDILKDLHFENLNGPFFGKMDKEAVERMRKVSELEVETESLGLKYQNANKADKEKMKSELKNKLNELFELKETNRKQEVEHLEKRLSELRKSLQERRDNKDEIVRKRMMELTGESKNMEW
ncbi:MAG: hypothetical protein ACM34K_12920 [Bacillota bacterium]